MVKDIKTGKAATGQARDEAGKDTSVINAIKAGTARYSESCEFWPKFMDEKGNVIRGCDRKDFHRKAGKAAFADYMIAVWTAKKTDILSTKGERERLLAKIEKEKQRLADLEASLATM